MVIPTENLIHSLVRKLTRVRFPVKIRLPAITFFQKRHASKETMSVTTKTKSKAWGKNCYFTVQSALLFPTDCLSKVTDPWANVTSQSIGCHALGSNIVFLSPQLVRFFTDCLPQKTYQLAWGNQSWGDTIPDHCVVCESVVCDACKTPAVIAKPLNVLVLELFSYFSL